MVLAAIRSWTGYGVRDSTRHGKLKGMCGEERRDHPRTTSDAPVYLMWEDHEGPKQARGRMLDRSEGGIGFQSGAVLPAGTICYLASPAHGICSRAMISHSRRSLLRTTAGARFLATL